MKKDKQQQQQLREEYLSLIKSVFPNCLWRFVEAFDDVFCGFEIAPEPGVMLVFRFGINNHIRVKIEAVYSFSGSYNHKRIMIINGMFPDDADSVPDFDFLRKILKHYKLFSE
jgi:hypothetical protein